jgi:predicted transposase/invertase (TIGR01784 family)
MTALEMWALYLRHANNPKYTKLIAEMINSREAIATTNSVLLNISQDERQRANYRSHRIFLQDQEHNLSIARKEGLEEGLEEGKKAVARSLLAMGDSIEKITKVTNLPREEIEKLR